MGWAGMDLRPYGISARQLESARQCAIHGLMSYQPFIFSDDFATGAGYEFAKVAEGAGMVYYPNVPEQLLSDPRLRRNIIDPALKEPFFDYNARLDDLYLNFIEAVERHVGPIPALSVADVGSCSGYFPVSFAQRGARRAVGFDLVDYGPSFALLNRVLGTKAEFVHKPYDARIGGIDTAERFDVVISIAVLVHLSDPLQHLAFLGRMARRAILVWTWTSENEEDMMAIRFIAANRYYKEAQFPHCFDVMQISPGLLRRSLELMGFTEIHQIRNRPNGMPDYWFDRHRGYLAIRPEANRTKAAVAPAVPEAQAVPRATLWRRLLGR